MKNSKDIGNIVLVISSLALMFTVLASLFVFGEHKHTEVRQKEIYSQICFSLKPIPPSSGTHYSISKTVPITSITIESSTLTGEEDITDERRCMLSENYAGEKYEITYLDEIEGTQKIQIPKEKVEVDISDENNPPTLKIVTTIFPKIVNENFIKSGAAKYVKVNETDATKMEYNTYFLNTNSTITHS